MSPFDWLLNTESVDIEVWQSLICQNSSALQQVLLMDWQILIQQVAAVVFHHKVIQPSFTHSPAEAMFTGEASYGSQMFCFNFYPCYSTDTRCVQQPHRTTGRNTSHDSCWVAEFGQQQCAVSDTLWKPDHSAGWRILDELDRQQHCWCCRESSTEVILCDLPIPFGFVK